MLTGRDLTVLALAFTEADVWRFRAAVPWQQQQPGDAVRWLDVAEARRVKPRIADETLGATLIEGGDVAQSGNAFGCRSFCSRV